MAKFDINEYRVSILFPKLYITFLYNFIPFHVLQKQLFGHCCGPNVFDIQLRTTTESTWKILKLDWKTPQKSGNPDCVFDLLLSVV